MNKLLSFFCCICIIFFIAGCYYFPNRSFISERLELLEEELFEADTMKQEMTDTIVGYLNNKDIESLKSLFCPKSQGLEDFDKQINAAIDLIDGSIISYDDKLMGSEGKSTEYGRITELDRRWGVDEVITDSGKKYELYIDYQVIYENDIGKVGIQRLFVENEEGTEVQIGYGWPEYYHEGSAVARDVVTALGNDDIKTIENLINQETKQKFNIIEQIENATSFFEGQAYMGKVEGDGLEYDGAYDYDTIVTDDEVVINNEPIETSIKVHCTNIMTNEDVIYEMELYSYLKNDNNKQLIRVSKIVLKDGDGNLVEIGN